MSSLPHNSSLPSVPLRGKSQAQRTSIQVFQMNTMFHRIYPSTFLLKRLYSSPSPSTLRHAMQIATIQFYSHGPPHTILCFIEEVHRKRLHCRFSLGMASLLHRYKRRLKNDASNQMLCSEIAWKLEKVNVRS